MPQRRLIGWLGWTGAVTVGWLLFSVVSLGQILFAFLLGTLVPPAILDQGSGEWIPGVVTVLTWLYLFLLGWVAGVARLAALRTVAQVTNLYPVIMALSWVGGSLVREQWSALVLDMSTMSPFWLNSPNTIWLLCVELFTLIGVAMVKEERFTKSPRWIVLGIVGAVVGCSIELFLGQTASGPTLPYGVSLALGGFATGAISGLAIVFYRPSVVSKRKNKKNRSGR